MVPPGQARNHRIAMERCEITESPWEGGNHRVTMGWWKP